MTVSDNILILKLLALVACKQETNIGYIGLHQVALQSIVAYLQHT